MNKLKPGHFKAYVLDYQGTKLNRIIVDTLDNGGCYTVEGQDETEYYEGKKYTRHYFNGFEKIKEPIMRSMTNCEMIEFLLENNVIVRKIGWSENDFYINCTFDNYTNPEEWLWRKSFDDEYQSFLIEDTKEYE